MLILRKFQILAFINRTLNMSVLRPLSCRKLRTVRDFFKLKSDSEDAKVLRVVLNGEL